MESALALQQKGDLDGAVAAYRSFLATHPTEVGAHSNLGVVFSKLGRYDEAEKEYREALKLDPSNTAIALNLVIGYYKSGRIPEAVVLLQDLLPRTGGNQQVMLLLADCYLRTGENKRVIELLQPVREKDASDLGVSYVLGMALLRDNRIAEGQVVLDRILKDSNSPEAHFLLGNQMFSSGDFPGAVQEFSTAAAIKPDIPSLQSYLGQALLNTGDPDGAAAAFRKELARDPSDFDANLHLAEILIERKQPAEATPLLERASRIRPGSPLIDAARKGHTAAPQSALLGKPAPPFTLSNVALQSYRGKSPVLLVFGSYSCPNFRTAAPALNDLYKLYGKRVPFLMVYIREAHSSADWQSTRNEREGVKIDPAKNMDEKNSHDSLCIRQLKIPFPAVVDGMDGKVEAAYEAWPSHAYLVDRDGIVRYATGLTELEFHADQLEAALKEIAK